MTYAVAEAELGAVQSKATKLLSSLGAKTILFPALQPGTSRVDVDRLVVQNSSNHVSISPATVCLHCLHEPWHA